MKKETDIKIKTAENRLQNNISTLEALSPLKVLARGYSYTEDTLGNVISSAEKINEKDNLFVTFSDGKIKVSVENKVMF